jgi:hypothetical protein
LPPSSAERSSDRGIRRWVEKNTLSRARLAELASGAGFRLSGDHIQHIVGDRLGSMSKAASIAKPLVAFVIAVRLNSPYAFLNSLHLL